jgi:hypothetical protein
MDMLDDEWTRRDLPFLIETARRLEAAPVDPVWAHEIGAALGLARHDQLAATARLKAAGYIRIVGIDIFDQITGISAEAARLVGLWPTAETG